MSELVARIKGLVGKRCWAHSDGRRCQLSRHHDGMHHYRYWKFEWGRKWWADEPGERPDADYRED